MKTVLITGANRGIGLGCVRHYVQAGWHVVAAVREVARADALQQLQSEHSDRLQIEELDVGCERSIQAFGDHFVGRHLELLLNNAGISSEENIGSWKAETFESHFRVNTIGPVLLAQTLAPIMAPGGKLINISSGMGSAALNINAGLGLDAYASSKAALNMLTARLATKLRQQGLIVVALSPGWVRTEMGGQDAPASVEEAVAKVAQTIERLTIEDSGRFVSENFETIPW